MGTTTRWQVIPAGGDRLSRDYLLALAAPFDTDEGTATHVLRWYDHQQRSWVVSYARLALGSHGQVFQIGDAIFEHRKNDAILEGERLWARAAAAQAGVVDGKSIRVDERGFFVWDETVQDLLVDGLDDIEYAIEVQTDPSIQTAAQRVQHASGIGAQDGDLVQAVYPGDYRPLLVPAGHAYAFAIRGGNALRQRAWASAEAGAFGYRPEPHDVYDLTAPGSTRHSVGGATDVEIRAGLPIWWRPSHWPRS